MEKISLIWDIIRNSVYQTTNIVDNIYYILISLIILITSGMVLSYRFFFIVNKINDEFSDKIENISIGKKPYDVNHNFKFDEALRFTLMGWIANTAGIGKIGIPTKALLLKKKGYSIKKSIASVTIDTTFDIIFSFLIFILGILFIPSIDLVKILNFYIFIISLIIILYIGVKFRIMKWLSFCADTINKIDKYMFWHLFALTSMAWILTSISYYFIIISSNEVVDFLSVFIVFNFSVVVGMISPIAGGIGVREGLLTFLTTTINITPEKGLAFALVFRLLNIIGFFIIFCMLKLKEMIYIEK